MLVDLILELRSIFYYFIMITENGRTVCSRHSRICHEVALDSNRVFKIQFQKKICKKKTYFTSPYFFLPSKTPQYLVLKSFVILIFVFSL